MAGRSISIALLLVLCPAGAWGNGAFPDTTAVLLPPDRPGTILVGTNFGLVISEDSGAHWRWTCEHDEGLNGYLYQLAPGAGVRLMALGNNGLVSSGDLACTWQTSDPPDPFVYDAFPDPATPNRVLLLAARVVDKQELGLIVESTDGGHTQKRILYTAPTGMQITTVEIAHSDPRVIYATLYQLDGHATTRVARSQDGGETWTLLETTGTQVPEQLWIAAVDPGDPQKVYFRVVTGDPVEKLAVSSDGGATVTIPLVASGVLSSFVRLDDGTLLVGALRMAEGHLYRSKDGAATFVELPNAVRPRGMAERAGKLYAATDNNLDHFALAVSENQGDSWKRVMAFSDIGSVSRCGALPFVCVNSCSMLANLKLVNPDLCQDNPTPAPSKGGCQYRPGGGGVAGPALLVALAALLAARRRQRS